MSSAALVVRTDQDTATGTGYIPGGSVTLAAGATFVTEVEYTVSRQRPVAHQARQDQRPVLEPLPSRQLTGKTTELVASTGQAKYLSVAQTAGTLDRRGSDRHPEL